MNKTRVIQTALASTVALAIVLGGLWFTDSSSIAKSSQRSICVNKETRDLKLRKNCRQNETFLAEAEVFTKGGKSAYQTWLDLGNKGTQAQFIASLQGSGGGSYNPLSNRRCTDVIALATNKFGKLVFFKDVWDYVEQNSNCKVGQTALDAYYYAFPDLNDVTTDFKATIDSASPIEVSSFPRRPAEYRVPLDLEFTLNLRGGWTVCDPSHPLYDDPDIEAAEKDRWVSLDQARISGTNSYRVKTTAYLASYGISLNPQGEYNPNSEDLGFIAVCKEDESSDSGWHLVSFFRYENYLSPAVFRGQNIHYISEWGWE